MCSCSQGGQWDAEVYEKEHGLQIKGGSPPPLLCPDEATSGVLCPILGSPVQERQGTSGESPVEGHKGDEDLEHFLYGKGCETWNCLAESKHCNINSANYHVSVCCHCLVFSESHFQSGSLQHLEYPFL